MSKQNTDLNQKKVCLENTIKAITYEINSAKERKDSAYLDNLSKDLDYYKSISADTYSPKIAHFIGKIPYPCEKDQIIMLENMSRSGPFYHVIGYYRGCEEMKGDKKYNITACILYRRYYPFPDYYVYVLDYKEME